MKEPFLKAVPILKQMEDAGYEAYFVGGAVRDYLLGKEIEDVDIATSALPQEVKAIFPKTVDVGIEHGTVLVLFKGEGYEITTFRSESEYENFRKPKEVTFIRSLYEDLKRRDFTMNAIAMNRFGEIIDPFFGQEAIQSKTITTVGKADERFHEDALRMMRAIRFVSQLGFTLEENTLHAILRNKQLLKHISTERLLSEFDKLLTGRKRSHALQMIANTGINEWLPGLKDEEKVIIKISQYSLLHRLQLLEMWALLCIHLNVPSVNTFLKKWRMSVKHMKTIQNICHAYNIRKRNEWTKHSLYEIGLDIALMAENVYSIIHNQDSLHSIKKMKELYNSLPIKDRSELKVNGLDIMKWENRQSGPWIKEKLATIEQAVIDGTVLNDKEHIRKWLYS